MPFNPDDAAKPGSGIFGLPGTRDDARIVLLPVPFDATTSYGGGTSAGPDAIRRASVQVDLFDRRLGRVYEQGIWMDEPDAGIAALSAEARALAEPIITRGGAEHADAPAVARVDAACERVNAFTFDRTREALRAGKLPGLVGGDHSTPFGAVRAVAEHYARSGGVGILHLDAHMDLRRAFEGFTWSHASIMLNVLERLPGVSCLVQLGIRDFGEGELTAARDHSSRVHVHFDDDWFERKARGESFLDLCRAAFEPLPHRVYISFDIDALDPSLCPHTGTPVPGGFSFQEAAAILRELRATGREVVGFDLVEVCPGPDPAEPEWDASVGARILYQLCGVAGPRR